MSFTNAQYKNTLAAAILATTCMAVAQVGFAAHHEGGHGDMVEPTAAETPTEASAAEIESMATEAVDSAEEMMDAKSSDASVYRCSQGNSIRTVAVEYTNAPETLPCDVIYTKESGETQTLYSAANTADYCEAKTQEFIAKLEGWGWSCSTK